MIPLLAKTTISHKRMYTMLTIFSFIIISLFCTALPLRAAAAPESRHFESIDEVIAALPAKYRITIHQMWDEHEQDKVIYVQKHNDLFDRGVLTQLSDQAPCDDAEKLLEIYEVIINELNAKAEAIRHQAIVRHHTKLTELCPIIFETNIASKMIDLAKTGESERAEVMRLAQNISKSGKLAAEKRRAIRTLVKVLHEMNTHQKPTL
jgi:hypothetical protein